jgi:glycosyltransferase involved in cell wall biosynthesis
LRNILFVIDNLGSGGAQRQLVSIACGLKDRGNTVHIFIYHDSLYFKDEVKKKQIPVHLKKKVSRFSITPVLEIRKLVSELKIDVVVSFLDTPNVYAELACLGKGVSLVVSERSSYVKDRITPVRRLMSYLHRMSDMVVANSHTHASWLKLNFPFLSEKVIGIVNGVDTDIFIPSDISLLEKSEADKSGTFHLIGIGRVASEKNILPVISALSSLRNKGIEISVDWTGRVGDDKYFSECESCIDKMNLRGHWKWLGERKDIPELLPLYDALIISSTREGFPNVVCEALACGLPVLGSRISDIPYLLGDKERGFLFDPQDEEDIEKSITRLFEMDFNERRRISRIAREFAMTELSLDALIDNYENLIVSLGT